MRELSDDDNVYTGILFGITEVADTIGIMYNLSYE